MLRFLGNALVAPIIGAFVTFVGFGVGILAIALAADGSAASWEVNADMISALCFAMAGQWLLWIRRLASGSDSVAGGLAIMGVGALFAGLIADPGTNPTGGRILFTTLGLAFFAWGGTVLRRGALSARAAAVLAAAAKTLGLHVAPLRWFQTQVARGAVQHVPVALTARGIRLGIEIRGSFPPDLLLTSEAGARLRRLVQSDITTGDSAFDAEVFIHGNRAAALAHLDATTRRMVAAAVRDGATVSGGAVHFSSSVHALPGAARESANALAVAANSMAALVATLAHDGPVPEALARNAADDPEPMVRARNLQALLALAPDAKGTMAACATALRDSDPGPRVAAACHVLARGSGASAARLDLLHAAVRALDGSQDARIEPLLLGLIREGDRPIALAAMRALHTVGGSKAIDALNAITHDLLADRTLKEAATQALDLIQARVREGAGQLSVATDTVSGQLSLPGSSGDLSEPEDAPAAKAAPKRQRGKA